MCKSMHKSLSNHIYREEVELWPSFRESFSIEEQEKIIGRMLGRTRAEVLQDLIPWLMTSLTVEEQHTLMSLWRKAVRNTMFDEWLGEWCEEYDVAKVVEESKISPSWTADPLEIISTYLANEVINEQKEGIIAEKKSDFLQRDHVDLDVETFRNCDVDDKEKLLIGDQNNYECSECTKLSSDSEKKRSSEVADATDQIDKSGQDFQAPKTSLRCEHLLTMSQEDLEATIRRVSRDSSLDLQKKSYIIQNLLMRLVLCNFLTFLDFPSFPFRIGCYAFFFNHFNLFFLSF